MDYKYIDSTEARENFASIINDAYATGTTYVVKKRGVPVAKIQRATYDEMEKTVKKSKKKVQKRKIDMSAFGMWADYEMDTLEIADYLRKVSWKGNYKK